MSERPYSVRPYAPGDEAGILALFNTVFSQGSEQFVARTRDHLLVTSVEPASEFLDDLRANGQI